MKYRGNYLNCLQFSNSKKNKNSFRGNTVVKFGETMSKKGNFVKDFTIRSKIS